MHFLARMAIFSLVAVGTTSAGHAQAHAPPPLEQLLVLRPGEIWCREHIPASLADRVHGRREIVAAVVPLLDEISSTSSLRRALALLDAVGAPAVDAVPAVMAAADRLRLRWDRGGLCMHPCNELRIVAQEVGTSAAAIAELEKLLTHPRAGVRRWSLNALELIGNAGSPCETALLEMLAKTPPAPDNEERAQTLEALAAVASRDTAIPLLVDALDDTDTYHGAVGLLVTLRATPELIHILSERPEALQILTADLLADVRWADPALAPPLRELCSAKDRRVRIAAAAALWRHDPSAPETLAVVGAALVDPSDEDSRQVLMLMYHMKSAAAQLVPQIRSAIGDERFPPTFRENLLSALTPLGSARLPLLPRLLDLTTDDGVDPGVRRAAIAQTGSLRPLLPAAHRVLLDETWHMALADANDDVVAAAAVAIHQHDPTAPEPLARLIERLDASPPCSDMICMAVAHWQADGAPAVPALIRHLRLGVRGPYPRFALIRIGAPALPALRDLAADGDPRLSKAAEFAISRIER